MIQFTSTERYRSCGGWTRCLAANFNAGHDACRHHAVCCQERECAESQQQARMNVAYGTRYETDQGYDEEMGV